MPPPPLSSETAPTIPPPSPSSPASILLAPLPNLCLYTPPHTTLPTATHMRYSYPLFHPLQSLPSPYQPQYLLSPHYLGLSLSPVKLLKHLRRVLPCSLQMKREILAARALPRRGRAGATICPKGEPPLPKSSRPSLTPWPSPQKPYTPPLAPKTADNPYELLVAPPPHPPLRFSDFGAVDSRHLGTQTRHKD